MGTRVRAFTQWLLSLHSLVLKISFVYVRNLNILKGQTEIVKSKEKTMDNKIKQKTNTEHKTLH